MKKILLFIIIPILLIGCEKKDIEKKLEKEIVYFQYEYGSGEGFYYTYKIENDNNKYIFTKEIFSSNDKSFKKEIDEKVLEELNKIINDNEIYNWNGFNKSDDRVLDGSGFTLIIRYNDESLINAHGYMKYPSNYKEAANKLIEFLNNIQ